MFRGIDYTGYDQNDPFLRKKGEVVEDEGFQLRDAEGHYFLLNTCKEIFVR